MKCKRCHIGRFQSTKLPYMTMMDDRLLVVPNISAYRCDVCGNVVFNRAFLERMQYIIEKLSQDDLAPQAADRLAISEQLANWQSTGRSS